jgi:hypothetical protein
MHSHPFERRRAARLACQIPILLRGGGRSVRSLSTDLSRVGAMLRIPFAEFGLPAGSSLADVGREAAWLLGDRVSVELHHHALGNLVQRVARPVRFGRGDPTQAFVEVGLDLLEPLTDMEAEFMGLPLPPLFAAQTSERWSPRPSRTRTGNHAHRHVTVVLCAQDDSSPPLRAVPARLDACGVDVELGRAEKLPLFVEKPGAASVMAALAEAYGSEPRSVLMFDAQPVWSGTARLEAVDLCPRFHDVTLQMGFPRPMSPGARARLGL